MSGLCQVNMPTRSELATQYNHTPEQQGKLVGSLTHLEANIINQHVNSNPTYLNPLRKELVPASNEPSMPSRPMRSKLFAAVAASVGILRI